MCSTFLVMNDRNGKYKELMTERQGGEAVRGSNAPVSMNESSRLECNLSLTSPKPGAIMHASLLSPSFQFRQPSLTGGRPCVPTLAGNPCPSAYARPYLNQATLRGTNRPGPPAPVIQARPIASGLLSARPLYAFSTTGMRRLLSVSVRQQASCCLHSQFKEERT